MAYPGLVKGGCSARICIFAHAQIVGRCGFERDVVRTYLIIERKPAP